MHLLSQTNSAIGVIPCLLNLVSPIYPVNLEPDFGSILNRGKQGMSYKYDTFVMNCLRSFAFYDQRIVPHDDFKRNQTMCGIYFNGFLYEIFNYEDALLYRAIKLGGSGAGSFGAGNASYDRMLKIIISALYENSMNYAAGNFNIMSPEIAMKMELLNDERSAFARNANNDIHDGIGTIMRFNTEFD